MFGSKMRIELEGFGVILRPVEKSEMSIFKDYLEHMDVVMYTNMTTAPTIIDEEEWWERARKDESTVTWGIVPDGSEEPVGVTSLHGLHRFFGCCNSGIVIGNKEWWGKGVAYRAHLARTWFAANFLNRYTIQSQVRTPNQASFKALMKVGYRISGKLDANAYRKGRYIDTYVLSWVNPRAVHILFPEGAPDELAVSLIKAEEALVLADSCVKFI